MKYLISRINFEHKFLYYIVGVLFVFQILIIHFFSDANFIKILETIISIICFVLFLWLVFNIFTEKKTLKEIELEVKDLEEHKEYLLNQFGHFRNEELLTDYKKILEKIHNENLFVYFIKSIEEIVKKTKHRIYLSILLIMYVAKNSLVFFVSFGPVIFIFLIFVGIIFCAFIFIKYNIYKLPKSSSPEGILILTCILFFFWGYKSYIKNFGTHELDSLFEKEHYISKYYVKIEDSQDSHKTFTLAADIKVDNEVEEGDTYYDAYGTEQTRMHDTRYVTVLKAYFPDGKILVFNKCLFEFEEEVKCVDQNGKEWLIEVTSNKVK